MACCAKVKTFTQDQKTYFSFCDKLHYVEEVRPLEYCDTTGGFKLTCGKKYEIADPRFLCSSMNHIWLCDDCRNKNFGDNSTSPPSKVKSCDNELDVNKLTPVSECFNHDCKSKEHFGPRTYKCGHKIEVSDCPEEHILECITCGGKPIPTQEQKLCNKYITVSSTVTAQLFSDCHTTQDHRYGPAEYKCGHVLDFTCPQEHILKCDGCEDRSLPSATSTPKAMHQTTHRPWSDGIVNMQGKRHSSINDALDKDNHCANKNHEYATRTRKYLSAAAREFLNQHRTCVKQFSGSQGPISKQLGDKVLQKCTEAFTKLQSVRQHCLEPFTEQEILEKGLDTYMDEKLDLYNEAVSLHDQYFNAHIIERELLQRTGDLSIQQNHPTTATTPHNPILQKTPIVPQPRQSPESHWSTQANIPIKHRDPTLGLPNQNIYSTAHPLQNQNIYSAAPPLHVPQPNGKQSQSSQAPIHKNTQSTTRPYFKLKDELDLVKKFAGLDQRKYMAFHAQWKNYIIKANQVNRSQLDLYHDLLSRLEPPAYDLCSTDYPSQDSYAAAIQTLNERYYNPSHLLRDMVKRTSKMSKMTDTYQSLLEASINLKKAKADLIQANLSEEQLQGLFLISTTEKYLSESAWREWNEIQNSPQFIADPMACFNIDNYLYAINQAMKNIHRKENALGINKPEANKFKPKSTLYGSYTTRVEKGNKITSNNYKQAKKNGKCIFCSKAPHRFQLYCKELKQKTPEQIRKIMNEHSIECAMCLVPGHSTQDCLATNQKKLRPCDIIEAGKPCNRYHCRYLHRKNSSRPNTNFTTTVKAEPTIDTNKPKS